jgi:hypothetical protein
LSGPPLLAFARREYVSSGLGAEILSGVGWGRKSLRESEAGSLRRDVRRASNCCSFIAFENDDTELSAAADRQLFLYFSP